MTTTKRRSVQLSVAAVAALAIFAAAAVMLLAGGFNTSPAQAEGGGNTGDDTLNNWPNPQPCGPGAGNAFMAEPHELHSGHYALFEGYWRTTNRGLEDDAAGVGALHMNECPPKIVEETQRDGTTVPTREISHIDIEEAIMHVIDKYKADVVATNAEITAGQLSLEEYPEVRRGLGLLGPNNEKLPVPAGTKVWWLRLDDPDTTGEGKDETSDLGIGFSTLLFDSDYWLTSTDGKPMRYKLEVERYPGDPDEPAEVPHLFTYRAPKTDNTRAELVWDDFRPGDEKTDMVMNPGEYEALQWVFTRPGTYVLTVELLGYVRKTNPHQSTHPDYDPNWKPSSSKDTQTKEAKYNFHVGPKLAENEPPIFGVNLSVAENSPAGTKVGGPVPVYNADAETLYYDLDGEGEDHFKTVPGTDPHTVQIVVAEGASLDYETRPSYDLELTVTDRLNHEGDKDSPRVVIDDTLIVRISLEDQEPGLNLQVDKINPTVGETVNLVARYEPTTAQAGKEISYVWAERIQVAENTHRWRAFSPPHNAPTWSVSQDSSVRKFYRVEVVVGDNTPPTLVLSNEVQIFWQNAGPGN